MNRRRFRGDLHGSLIVPVGWLFADLLLALAMLFLVANTFGTPPKPTPVVVKATPTPTATPSPTPTPVQRILEANYCEVRITVDYNGILNNSPGAVSDAERQISQNTFLNGRRAGLVVIYGGAATDIRTAQNIANHVRDNVLKDMGNHKIVFVGTSYFDPLFQLDNDPSIVALDIYLLTRPDSTQDTCGTDHKPLHR